MKYMLLSKIRLSWFFVFFFLIFFILLDMLPRYTFTGGALTLFSVNSFLYGFYITPILGAQKSRIEELHKIARAEANAIFAMVLSIKNLPDELKDQLKALFNDYLSKTSHGKAKAGEKAYEELITFCVDYKGAHKAEMDKLLEKLVANQQNRTNYSMQLGNKVFSNEWMITAVLFTITLSFILLIDAGGELVTHIVTALLATSLSMLILILIKLSTLTHKKARHIWDPFKTLLKSRYYRIDE